MTVEDFKFRPVTIVCVLAADNNCEKQFGRVLDVTDPHINLESTSNLGDVIIHWCIMICNVINAHRS